MGGYTEEELADNRLGLKHRRLGTLETVKIDTLVQHPDTPAYYDGREGIDYREQEDEEEDDETEE